MEKLKQYFDEIIEYIKDKDNRWLIIIPIGAVLVLLFFLGAFKNKKKFAKAMRYARNQGRKQARRYGRRYGLYKRRR